MIELGECHLSEGPNLFCGGRVSVTFVPSKADRPVGVMVESESARIVLDNFAQRSFHPATRTKRPSIEIATWDDVFIILGLLDCVIFKPRRSPELDAVRLFRSVDEDSGFHATRFIEAGDRLLLVYEGGVMCVDRASNVMWHSKKYWDDVLVSASADRVCFLGYGEETYCLDVESGARSAGGSTDVGVRHGH